MIQSLKTEKILQAIQQDAQKEENALNQTEVCQVNPFYLKGSKPQINLKKFNIYIYIYMFTRVIKKHFKLSFQAKVKNTV